VTCVYTLPRFHLTHGESADDGPEDVRLARQAELNKLIVQLFRRRPGLNYFQVCLRVLILHPFQI